MELQVLGQQAQRAGSGDELPADTGYEAMEQGAMENGVMEHGAQATEE